MRADYALVALLTGLALLALLAWRADNRSTSHRRLRWWRRARKDS